MQSILMCVGSAARRRGTEAQGQSTQRCNLGVRSCKILPRLIVTGACYISKARRPVYCAPRKTTLACLTRLTAEEAMAEPVCTCLK